MFDTDTSNPASGIRTEPTPPEFLLYDTDDPENTKDDPVVKRHYQMTQEAQDAIEQELDASWENYFELILVDEEDVIDVLDDHAPRLDED